MKTLRAALLGLAACALGTGRSAVADFQFDPTGGGGGQVISAFDPSPGNALAQGGVTAIGNFAAGGPVAGNTFQLYYQAHVGTLVLPNGTTISPPGQLTIVASVTETVTSVFNNGPSNNGANFAVDPVQSAGSFMRIYSNPGVTYNDLAGTGFTDGTLILSANPVVSTAGSGSFTTTGGPVLFDQHGTDNFGGKQSTEGNGVSTIDFATTSVNSGFFPTGAPSVISLRFITSSSTPFVAVDPSQSFASLGASAPNLGAINGVSGPDFQFVADAFVTPTTVPEPSSLALTGLGLAGVVAFARRKRAQVA